MLIEPEHIYLHVAPIDFRKSINGLHAIVEQEMTQGIYQASSVFIFCNKGRDKIKMIYGDKTGFALWYKRLEKDKFKWPKQVQQQMTISASQLKNLLSGLSIIGHQSINTLGLSL